jgi:hypothetical protein
MKLVIHMGLHKTGTTTFQNFLHLNKKALLDTGLIYPNIGGDEKSHWQIPHQLLRNNWGYLHEYMKMTLNIAKQQNANTVFISSEDFETMLIESYRAVEFENLLFNIGFSEIHWECVLRNQWDYFNSLYAEMSKHKICLNFASAGEEIINFGEISMGNADFRFRFAFDYDSFIERFLKDIKGSFTAISFDDFIANDFIGKELLNKHIDYEVANKTFWESNLSVAENANIRGYNDTIEINYLANFLGISITKKNFLFKKKPKKIFIPIIRKRQEMIDMAAKDLEHRFIERFPEISSMLK